MEIISFIAGVVSDRLKVSLSFILEEFGAEVLHVVNNNILEYQVEEYKRNYEVKTLLHRVEPKKLADFYYPLSIRRLFVNGEVASISLSTNLTRDLFYKFRYITLVGSAGSGKSTIVKYLFLNAYDSNFKIPITIELRYLNDFSGGFIDFIREKIFKVHKLATNDKIIDRLLNSGQFIFFLDGYDEISSRKRHSLTRNIDDFVSVYPRNYYMLTSRPFSKIDLLPRFVNFGVCNLNEEDIEKFIKKQIPISNAELSDKIISAINNHENKIYKGFLENPLLLSMFILTFQSYSNIPQKRSDFFYQVFDTLFSTHDSMTKMAFVREKESGLSKEGFVEVLKMFSFISYFKDKFIFSEPYVYEQFNLIKLKKKDILFDNEKLTEDLQIAIGVLIKDGIDYSFPHRALQEYFAASYVSCLSIENKKNIYSKIFMLPYNGSFLNDARENFLIILNELDRLNLIEFGLINFFQGFIDFNYSKLDYKKIIIHFNSLIVMLKAFNSIVMLPLLRAFVAKLPLLVDEYTTELEIYNASVDVQSGILEPELNIERQVQIKLANSDIKPMLKLITTELKDEIARLRMYLWEENKGDEDMISMI